MRSRKKAFIILVSIITILIAGCSKTANPEEVLENYVSHWNQEEFSSMYEMLSTDTKEYISQEEFISRYETIYGGIDAKDISIAIDEVEENQDTEFIISIPYTLKMDTLAGKVEFSHEATLILEEGEEEKEWTIEWEESMIFPQMEAGDTVKVETITAKRGEIHDRNGIALAKNGEIRLIGIVPGNLGDRAEVVKKRLAEVFETTIEDIEGKLNAGWVRPDLFVPIGAIPSDERTLIEELTALPGVLYQNKTARVYPLKEATAHLVGYVGDITMEELEKREGQNYNEHDVVGKTGIELLEEEQLRGIDGKAINIVKEDNNLREDIITRDKKDGKEITLTIDAIFQRDIYEEMVGDKGTAIAMHPMTGEVLAMVNSPAYDPNAFILGLSTEQWNGLNEDVQKPLLNRFALIYSPGSVFKPITAGIGLEKGTLDPDRAINISGLQWQKDSSWGNYYINRVKDSGSPINLRDAFVYSDNIYFAKTALDIGEKAFLEGAKTFGIGEEIPFGYPIKSSQIANDDTLSGEIQLADSGYGQGQVSLSPLHLTTIYTSFLQEGNMVQPLINLEDKQEEVQYWKENSISKATANLIKEDLIQVLEHPQGTGREGKIEGLSLGGKTGTAELKSSQGEEGQEYGWFMAFDAKDSNIILTMMIEEVEDRGGSAYVIPKVKKILENYLK